MNIFQRLAADCYGNGDFSYIENAEQAQDVGDTCFTFLINELSTQEGCGDRDTALSRLDTVLRDVQLIHNAIEDYG